MSTLQLVHCILQHLPQRILGTKTKQTITKKGRKKPAVGTAGHFVNKKVYSSSSFLKDTFKFDPKYFSVLLQHSRRSGKGLDSSAPTHYVSRSKAAAAVAWSEHSRSMTFGYKRNIKQKLFSRLKLKETNPILRGFPTAILSYLQSELPIIHSYL